MQHDNINIFPRCSVIGARDMLHRLGRLSLHSWPGLTLGDGTDPRL